MTRPIFTVLLLFIASNVFSQKLRNEKGDLSILKNEKALNIEFDYSHLTLYNEKISESEYIDRRVKDLNEKTAGEGDIWLKRWKNAPENIWESKFQELLLKTATQSKGIRFTENKDAKYTLIVDVVWIYPGWDAGVMKQPAKLSTDLKIVETSNKSNIIYQIQTENAPGNQWGSNFSNESRIGEGFAKTAKTFGKLLAKKL